MIGENKAKGNSPLWAVGKCFRLEPSSNGDAVVDVDGGHDGYFQRFVMGSMSPACDRPTRTSLHNIFNSLFCGGCATEFHEKILHVPFFIHCWHHERFHLLIFLAMFLLCRYGFALFRPAIATNVALTESARVAASMA